MRKCLQPARQQGTPTTLTPRLSSSERVVMMSRSQQPNKLRQQKAAENVFKRCLSNVLPLRNFLSLSRSLRWYIGRVEKRVRAGRREGRECAFVCMLLVWKDWNERSVCRSSEPMRRHWSEGPASIANSLPRVRQTSGEKRERRTMEKMSKRSKRWK